MPAMQDEANELLDEGDYFQSDPALESMPPAEIAAVADEDDDLNQFLAFLPGTDTESDTISRLMNSEKDDDDADDS